MAVPRRPDDPPESDKNNAEDEICNGLDAIDILRRLGVYSSPPVMPGLCTGRSKKVANVSTITHHPKRPRTPSHPQRDEAFPHRQKNDGNRARQ